MRYILKNGNDKSRCNTFVLPIRQEKKWRFFQHALSVNTFHWLMAIKYKLLFCILFLYIIYILEGHRISGYVKLLNSLNDLVMIFFIKLIYKKVYIIYIVYLFINQNLIKKFISRSFNELSNFTYPEILWPFKILQSL